MSRQGIARKVASLVEGGERVAAVDLVEKAVADCELSGRSEDAVFFLVLGSQIARADENAAKALELATRAVAAAVGTQPKLGAVALLELGLASMAAGRYALAVTPLAQLADLATALRDFALRHVAADLLASSLSAAGDHAGARVVLEESARALLEEGQSHEALPLLIRQVAALHQAGDGEAAAAVRVHAEAVAEALGNDVARAELEQLTVWRCANTGDPQGALAASERAFDHALESCSPLAVANAAMTASSLYLGLDRRVDAATALDVAEAVVAKLGGHEFAAALLAESRRRLSRESEEI